MRWRRLLSDELRCYSRVNSHLSFFFHNPANTEIYTLSLHDALPIFIDERHHHEPTTLWLPLRRVDVLEGAARGWRSEEHTSELQSRLHLVCRLLLEKKKKDAQDGVRHADLRGGAGDGRRSEVFLFRA